MSLETQETIIDHVKAVEMPLVNESMYAKENIEF